MHGCAPSHIHRRHLLRPRVHEQLHPICYAHLILHPHSRACVRMSVRIRAPPPIPLLLLWLMLWPLPPPPPRYVTDSSLEGMRRHAKAWPRGTESITKTRSIDYSMFTNFREFEKRKKEHGVFPAQPPPMDGDTGHSKGAWQNLGTLYPTRMPGSLEPSLHPSAGDAPSSRVPTPPPDSRDPSPDRSRSTSFLNPQTSSPYIKPSKASPHNDTPSPQLVSPQTKQQAPRVFLGQRLFREGVVTVMGFDF